MSANSKIAWTDHTANFWWGCQKVSEGCKNCYAEKLSERYGKKIWGPPKTTTRERKIGIWKDILEWDAAARAEGVRRRVFVSSMSDFLEDHPAVEAWRDEAMDILAGLEWLDVLLLTKRPENACWALSRWTMSWPDHIWFGVSVEDNNKARRINDALDVPARVHFFSVEPMLERVDMHFTPFINRNVWVICGGESGAHHRPFNVEWARDLRDQCRAANAPFFMKQLGGHPYHYDQMQDFPADLQIREFPE